MPPGDLHDRLEEAIAIGDTTGTDVFRISLEQMIEHHEGALAMAEDEVADGQNPDAVDLAQSIVDTQQAEIRRCSSC